jgi:1,3-beta-glucan synthase
VFLTREYKHDETNRAWWTGKWYGRGLGTSAMSQPAREFIVKIVEMSLWSSDFLLGHFLLMLLTPPILIPFIDRLHSTMLCKPLLWMSTSIRSHIYIPVWLRPSKQIRPPMFSTKQKRQRRWIVRTPCYKFHYNYSSRCILRSSSTQLSTSLLSHSWLL